MYEDLLRMEEREREKERRREEWREREKKKRICKEKDVLRIGFHESERGKGV